MTAHRGIQSRLLRTLSGGGGDVPFTEAASIAGGGAAELAAAVEDLVSAGLVELGTDGRLRIGSRGSLLSEPAVRRSLRTDRYGRELEIHAALGSTNDLVLERAASGAAPGLVIAAELQTGGRGRHGRAFDSPPGLGVWCTTLLETPGDPAAAPRRSLLAAVAVCEAVEDVAGVRPQLKWPNDVRLGGRKICGVLVEARTVGPVLFLVAGIGINVHQRAGDFAPEIRDSAASLESAGVSRPDRSRLLAAVLNRLESVMDADATGGLDLPARFAAWDEFRNRSVRLPGIGRKGVARGVDDEGQLRLEVSRGEWVVVRSAEGGLEPE